MSSHATGEAFEAGQDLARPSSTPVEDVGARESVEDVGARESVEDADSGARVRFRATGEGYAYVTTDSPHDGRERPHYLHRLAAVAWGLLDGLDDPRHVHHCEHSIPWLNVEWNLEAVDEYDHADVHLHGGGQA